METDARGQLGGIDTSDVVRRRLAQESGLFRCQTCARSNDQIIAEAQERAQKSSSTAEHVQIPQELSMSFRDEMEASEKSNVGAGAQLQSGDPVPSAPRQGEDVSDSAELAEGFLKTDPTSSTANHPKPSQPAVHHPPRQSPGARPVHQNNGVPLWIDRAIVALVVVLAALLLRVIFGI